MSIRDYHDYPDRPTYAELQQRCDRLLALSKAVVTAQHPAAFRDAVKALKEYLIAAEQESKP